MKNQTLTQIFNKWMLKDGFRDKDNHTREEALSVRGFRTEIRVFKNSGCPSTRIQDVYILGMARTYPVTMYLFRAGAAPTIKILLPISLLNIGPWIANWFYEVYLRDYNEVEQWWFVVGYDGDTLTKAIQDRQEVYPEIRQISYPIERRIQDASS